MRITLHVGPHKTGTTSVQHWLHRSRQALLDAHGLYYPQVGDFPPGHALIAWRTLGVHGHEADPDVLRRTVEEAVERGAHHLVLSSEEFSRGLSRGNLRNLQVLNEHGSVDLVLTLTPTVDRFVSEIAEEIKHGEFFEWSNIDVPAFCMRRPGLRPNLVQEVRAGVRPLRTHVVLAQKDHPTLIFEAFARILEIPGPTEITAENQRLTDARTRLLNFLNSELTGVTAERRRSLSCGLEAFLVAEGVGDQLQRITLPKPAMQFLTQLWRLQRSLLQAMDVNGDIRLYPRGS